VDFPRKNADGDLVLDLVNQATGDQVSVTIGTNVKKLIGLVMAAKATRFAGGDLKHAIQLVDGPLSPLLAGQSTMEVITMVVTLKTHPECPYQGRDDIDECVAKDLMETMGFGESEAFRFSRAHQGEAQ
jgi:hypothetical protein